MLQFLFFAAMRRTFVLKLISSPASPYSRKVRIALAEKKIKYQLEDASPWGATNPVHEWNPLGKVPTLVLDDGTQIYDSRVIVEYLDTVSPVSRLIPEPGRERIAVRRWEALADGICDAAIAAVLESRRPAQQQSKEWIARQHHKVRCGVADLARELGGRAWCSGDASDDAGGGAYSLADIATGCALGYLDLRQPEFDWRDDYPNLGRLAERLSMRTSFQDTAPPPTA